MSTNIHEMCLRARERQKKRNNTGDSETDRLIDAIAADLDSRLVNLLERKLERKSNLIQSLLGSAGTGMGAEHWSEVLACVSPEMTFNAATN